MKKLIISIFISFGAIFLMSHNASAANLSYNLNDYDWIRSVNLGTQYCAYSYNTFTENPTICILNHDRQNMYGIKTYNIDHEKGDISEFHIAIQNNIYSSSTNFAAGSFGLYLDNFGSYNDHFKIIGFEKVDAESLDWANYTNSNYNCTVTYPNVDYSLMQCSSNNTNIVDVFRIYTKIYKVTILWTDAGAHPVMLNALNANTPLAKCFIEPNLVVTNTGQCQVRLFGYTQWGYVGSNVNKEQEDKTQSAADDSKTSGNSSTSDATTATSSLLSVIGTGIGAITSATPTNCKINGNMGNLNIGNIDLCANPVPSFISVIGSIIAVLVVLPLVIVLFNRFISIIRSFQN